MAIDTRDKRASAVLVGIPWRGLLPLPDGAVGQGDRQQAVWLYRGISASVLVQRITIYAEVTIEPWIQVGSLTVEP